MRFEPEYRGHYGDIVEHDEDLIREWNEVVRPNDIVWVLGDFAFPKRSLQTCGPRLIGHKKLVMGNHDKHPTQAYLDAGFEKLYGVAGFERDLVLSHCPLHLPEKGRWSVNIHGHSHSKGSPPTGRHYSVSIEECIRRTAYPRPMAWEEMEKEIGEMRRAVLEPR